MVEREAEFGVYVRLRNSDLDSCSDGIGRGFDACKFAVAAYGDDILAGLDIVVSLLGAESEGYRPEISICLPRLVAWELATLILANGVVSPWRN